jgi:drug/metabolite transporter (DMT)-like permease
LGTGLQRPSGDTPPKEAVVNKTLGLILIVLGVLSLAWGGFTYTTRQKVVDVGPIHATRDKRHHVTVLPIIGAVAIIGGIVFLVARKKE